MTLKLLIPRFSGSSKNAARAGVDVRILGKLEGSKKLFSRELLPMRLHTRSIVRDREHVFIGSQSLRTAELEERREVGILFKNQKIAKEIIAIFEQDWHLSKPTERTNSVVKPAARKVAKRFAKAISKISRLWMGC